MLSPVCATALAFKVRNLTDYFPGHFNDVKNKKRSAKKANRKNKIEITLVIDTRT